MFCESCGKQLPDNARFCENCGAPQNVASAEPVAPAIEAVIAPAEPVAPAIETVIAPAEPVAPVIEAEDVLNDVPVDQPVAIPAAQPVFVPVAEPMATPIAVATPVLEQPIIMEQPMPATVVAPVTPKPRKPINVKSLILIIVAIVLAAAIAVSAIIIIPRLNKVKVEEFIDIKFSSEFGKDFYDGMFSISVGIDADAIAQKEVKAKKLQKLLGQQALMGTSKCGYLIEPITQYCEVTYRVKGADDDSFVKGRQRTDKISKDDIIEVKIHWDQSDIAKNAIKAQQKNLGIVFDTNDAVINIKVADQLKKDDIDVEEVPTFDLLGKLKEEGCFDFDGIGENIRLVVSEFEFESNGYTFSRSSSGTVDSYFYVNYYSDNSSGSVCISIGDEYGETDYLKGDKLRVAIDGDDMLDNGALFFTTKKIQLTVDGDEVLTASKANSKAKQIVEVPYDVGYFDYEDDWYFVEGYFFTENSDLAEYENVAMLIYRSEGYYYDSFYAILAMDLYLDDDGYLCYDEYDYEYLGSSYDGLSHAKDECYSIDWSYFTSNQLSY